jgi:hypothetical protein
MQRTSRLALSFVLMVLVLPLAASAQVYKVTDEDKGVVFTDRPENVSGSSSVERIEIREPNTAPPPPAAAPSRSPAKESAPERPPEATITITSPANESTIAMGPGNFAVSAQASPPLGRGEELVLLMDGQPVGAAQSGTSWFIEGALRGPHDLVVQRRTTSGQSVAVSEPVRVYVLRPSIR